MTIYIKAIFLTLSLGCCSKLLGSTEWNSNYFSESSKDGLVEPSLGDSDRRLQKNKFSSYLFMGTNFAPPDELPLGITIHGLAKEVEDRQATFGFIINSGITALQLLPGDAKKNVLIGSRNLKELFRAGDPRRYQLEDSVNVSYSIFCAILGVNPDTADKLAGLVAIGSYAMSFKFFPYGDLDSHDKGDDPRGSTFSGIGREYYYSGQYMKDYFYFINRRYGWTSYSDDLDFTSRIPVWQEAIRRIELRKDLSKQEIRTTTTSIRLQWKAIDIARTIEEDYSNVLKVLKAQEQARMESERLALQEKERVAQQKAYDDWYNEIKRQANILAEEQRRKAEAQQREILKKQAEDDWRRKQEEAARDAEKKKKMEDDEKERAQYYQRQRDTLEQSYNYNNTKTNHSGGGGSTNSSSDPGGLPATLP